MNYKYCNNLASYSRLKTRIVDIGDTPLGGNNPIRIQTMANTNTLDTQATIEQCIRCFEAGAEYVRITTPGVREAKNLVNIKKGLLSKGYKFPLIADIHFNPKAAEIAAGIVEKVRINPGNYSDTKKFQILDFTDKQYQAEIEKIHDKILPLLKICRQNGTAIRIGVNHGSLSDRIMSRYGDTPLGMVESAMEFLNICEAENFDQLVFSLKASNTRVMVYAYRLLVNRMMDKGTIYPLHLGVTEAGDKEDGRIKSAVGIGTLLSDGIGDTVRVSLTEDPEAEIPVAKAIVSYFKNRKLSDKIHHVDLSLKNPFEYSRHETIVADKIGGNNLPIVISDWDKNQVYENTLTPDFYYLRSGEQPGDLPEQNRYIWNMKEWFITGKRPNIFPLYTDAEFLFYGCKSEILNFIVVSNQESSSRLFDALEKCTSNVAIVLETFNSNGVADQRSFFYQLLKRKIKIPVIINRNYPEDDLTQLEIKSSADIGSLLIDGFGDGIWLRNAGGISQADILSTAYGILQASRVRISKTEYISCPSCGRTLFNLQAVLANIKAHTSHLKHLKIGVMGCIVNGPGEMADADYGYVGASAGKVTLYKGKEVIRRNIPAELAVDELVQLIKDNGDWNE